MGAKKVIQNVLAGALVAVINITVAISVAALIFTGTEAEYLAPGIVMLMVGTLVTGLGGTFLSDFPGVICAPKSALAPVFAAIVGGIYAKLSVDAPDQVLPTMLVAIMATSVVTGVFFLILGQLRLGNLVRYIPYPVMGGFFAGIGFLFVTGGLSVAMGQPPGLDTVGDAHLVQLGLPAIAFAVLLYVLLGRFDHWSTFPAALAGAFAVFYAIFFATGQSLPEVAQAGWLPLLEDSPGLMVPVVGLSDLAAVDWPSVTQAAGGMAIVAILSAIALLLDVSGIEILTKLDLDPDRELKTMGVTNVVSGAVGGYPGVHAASDTAFTFKLGGDGRLMGVVYAVVLTLTILAGTGFIGKVPTFILGGLLVYVGLGFLTDWVWKARRELPTADYVIVILILVVIATVDILLGVAFGFAVAIVLFVVNYAKLSLIKSEATGSEHASNVDHDLETRELLNQQGERIRILMIQGFVFFGTADKLVTEIRERVEGGSERSVDFLVLDMHHVTQLDTSAIQAFSKLSQLSDRFGFHVVVTAADAATVDKLRAVEFFSEEVGAPHRLAFDQLDDGVAWCEERILEEHGLEAGGGRKELLELLSAIAGSREAAEEMAPHFSEVRKNEGEYLFRQGEPGESLYLVGSGSVAVRIDHAGGPRVLRRYQSGALLGEMALYTGEPRSASVLVEEDSVLYRLDQEGLDEMHEQHHATAVKLHAYVVQLLAERLKRANVELQRLL